MESWISFTKGFPKDIAKQRKLDFKSEPSNPDEAETFPPSLDKDDISFEIQTFEDREF